MLNRTILPRGINVSDHKTFHATFREGVNKKKIELLFGSRTKLLIFQDCLDSEYAVTVFFETYRGERMAFRSICTLPLGDRRLSYLQLLSLRWSIHHFFLEERSKFAKKCDNLKLQCFRD